MRNHLPIAVAAGIAMLPAVAAAQAPSAPLSSQLGIYGGAGVGVAKASFEEADFVPPAGTTRSDSRHEAGGKGFVGWRFHRYLAVEGAYHYLGKFDVNYNGPAASGQSTHKVDGWGLSALGIAPLAPNFSLYGRVGAFNGKVKTTVTGTTPANLLTTEDRTTSLLLGGGVQWDINSRWAVRGEYENYGEIGNSTTGQLRNDMWSASALFKF
ncbi:MAG: outer membrane beta-barrel protein [Burkholderiales bacterium]|nr:outer membrane beta-barrel protein [Burkholderiales bacterium]